MPARLNNVKTTIGWHRQLPCSGCFSDRCDAHLALNAFHVANACVALGQGGLYLLAYDTPFNTCPPAEGWPH